MVFTTTHHSAALYARSRTATLAIAIVLLSMRVLAQTNGPGAALQYNGTNSYVSIATTGSLTGTFTVELWANPLHPTNTLTLVSSCGATADFGFDFKLTGGDRIHGEIGNGSSWLTNAADVGYFYYSTQDWRYVAYVVTPTNYTIYTDGAEAGGGIYASNNPVLYDSIHHLIIGSAAGTSEFMEGLIDEMRIWSTARSASEIRTTMARSLLGSEAGLMGYWRFDEGTGTTAADSSGHGFTAFLTNSPSWIPSTAPVGAPPVVTVLTATNLSPASATLNGSVIPNYLPTSVGFAYGFTTNYDNSTPLMLVYPSNAAAVAVSRDIAGLFPGVAYHFRLVAQNLAGASIGADQTFTTSQIEAVYPTPYTVTTLAGVAGDGIVDGIGKSARFGFTDHGATAVDAGGNILVADGEVIRKITPAGVVTTIAGFPGAPGITDGTNSAARFGRLGGISRDYAGNLYVTDSYAKTIRKVTPVGTNWVVTTIAGIAGGASYPYDAADTRLRFHSPNGIAIDSATNLYVTDIANDAENRVLRLTPVGTNWVLSGYAGGGDGNADGRNTDAQFSKLSGIAVDLNGNAYVADRYTIRKIAPDGGDLVVSTIAGSPWVPGDDNGTNSDAHFNQPWGIAVDSNTNLFVTDSGNSRIRKVTPSGTNWVVTTLAGNYWSFSDGVGTNALFEMPTGIAVSSSGNLYVADSSTIRLVTSAGLVRTLAGIGPASLGGSDGMGSAARFNLPCGVTVDDTGNVYVADTENHTIRQITSAGVVSTIAGSVTNPGSADGVGDQAHFWEPKGVAVNSAGNVYVADQDNHTIREINPAGLVTTLAGLAGADGFVDGLAGAARFAGPNGITVDNVGNLYVADSGNSAIRKVTPSGVVTTIAGSTNAGSADGTGTAAQFGYPRGVAVDSAGNVYIADTWNHTIRMIAPVGTNWDVTTIAGLAGEIGFNDGTGAEARFQFPTAIAADSSGNLFVGDGNYIVRKLTREGTNWTSTTVAGLAQVFGSADGTGSDARFKGPSGIAVDSSGTLYVADHSNNTIRKGYFSKFAAVSVSAYTRAPVTGQLQVTLLPPEANGQWRFGWERNWRNSGEVVSNLVAGNYPVEFRNVPGYLAPPVSVAVSGGLRQFTNEYYPTLVVTGTNTGSLKVVIEPNSPPGAGWRFFGESDWRAPGSSSSGLLPDTYFIEFEPATNYSKPASRAVEISADLTVVIKANYLLAQSPPGGISLPTPVPAAYISDVNNYPFGFNGQLETDAGYGSGVLVVSNVVLTAAHMVFDDQTLSYVSHAYWFFQREKGVFEPLPQEARGWYVLSGYAAQRSNDLSSGVYRPDQSSPQSRNLDVAALYFQSSGPGPAYAGYGGYLPSDASPNPWLTGRSQKMLVGYPVDGSVFGDASIVPGLMYQILPQPYPLTLASDPVFGQQVYTANWFLSYPGNSGGPFYVQFNGSYYPAGVYLGTLFNGTQPYGSLVRGIDSNVVDLITRAAILGDAGTNSTGGGVITIIPSQGITKNPGLVQGYLLPPEALQSGAAWRLHGDTTYSTGPNYTRAITTTNEVIIEFKPIPYWNLPSNQTFTLGPGDTKIYTSYYTLGNPTRLEFINGAGIGISGSTGTTHRLEYRPSLLGGTWLPLRTNTILTNGFNLLMPWTPTNGPAGFYRSVWLP